ncbi:MAG: HPr family phosphocarrier protein [Clostridiales bacterium]|nr:HPr family phosphocarrier protein [Clostridiales bacterium]
MKTFDYTITDELGIHARPAGELVKEAKKYTSALTITSGDRNVGATKLMSIMSLGVKKGMTITVTAEGDDEEAAAAGMKAFLEANL